MAEETVEEPWLNQKGVLKCGERLSGRKTVVRVATLPSE